MESVQVIVNDRLLGYVVNKGQRTMIRDFSNNDTRLVMAQIVRAGFDSLFLQVYYYKSKTYLDRKNAEYEKEKETYIRKPPKSEEFALVSNGSEYMQWNIGLISSGDEIWVEEDERMLVLTCESDYEIGYVPKSTEGKLHDLYALGYEITGGKITNVFETKSQKKGVSVSLTLHDTSYL